MTTSVNNQRELIEQIRKRVEAATQGEWYWSNDYLDRDGGETKSLIASANGGFGVLSCDGLINSPIASDEALIAHAPTDIKTLLSINEKQRKALQAAREFITNGTELGYIFMPDEVDPASRTLPMIIEAQSYIPEGI